MARAQRIVLYAVNGSGVGHLTRLVAISRWLRRYARQLDRKLEFWFLTTSEADSILFHERFASFKLPSKTSVGESGIRHSTYLALAKQWIWHSLGLLQPDLFIVDTFPRGSFGELLSTLDLCRRKAFIYRPMKKSFAKRPDFQAMLPLYDRIIIPDRQADLPVPDKARSLVRHTDQIMVREVVELLPRPVARQRLGVAEDSLAVYISAGGGGDPTAGTQLDQVLAALIADPRLHLIVGAGPLYRGRQHSGERLTWISGGGVTEQMPAFDMAVCAAGYNTYGELMQAGIPTIFLPQAKVADEQDVRAEGAVESGAAQVLSGEFRVPELLAALEIWREEIPREAAAAAARRLVPVNGARDAAAELLSLIFPEDEVEQVRDQADEILTQEAEATGISAEKWEIG